MNEMIERVSRAMEPYLWDQEITTKYPEFVPEIDKMREYSIARARKAIEAMREPTQSMLDAARSIDPGVINDEYAPASQHWAAMIDEALK